MFDFSIEIEGQIDSKELWHLLEPLNVNLIDLGDSVFVFGQTSSTRLGRTICICSRYGKVKGDFCSTDGEQRG